MICASGNAPDAGRFYRRYHPIRGPNMATAEEHLMDWLRDAHAMEEQAEKMLRATAGRLENYPDLKARLESHAPETHRQAELREGRAEGGRVGKGWVNTCSTRGVAHKSKKNK